MTNIIKQSPHYNTLLLLYFTSDYYCDILYSVYIIYLTAYSALQIFIRFCVIVIHLAIKQTVEFISGN